MRKKIDFDSITESRDGESRRLPAGPYVIMITGIEDNEPKEYLEVLFDIAEGPYAGFYSDAWGKEHKYAHHFFLSYKDRALNMLKGRLNCITESNPGFDAIAAFNGDNLGLFVTRKVGVVIQEEEYLRDERDDIGNLTGRVALATRLNVAQVVPAQKVRDGEARALDRKPLSDEDRRRLDAQNAPATKTPAGFGTYDVPFD